MRRAVGNYNTNPHAYIARFGIVGESREWIRYAIVHGGLIDLKSRRPHIADFIDPDSVAVAEGMGVRIDRGRPPLAG